MDKVYIYSLEDPETGEIRYVGKANNIKSRFYGHLNEKGGKNTHKKNWINFLKSKGLKPVIKVLDEVSINEWKFWEKWWYQVLKSWGLNLTNTTVGGDGLTFGNNTSFKKGEGSKPIIAFNKDGSIFKEFDSESSACLELNINNGHLTHVLKGRQKTAGGFAWFYSDQIPDKEIILSKFKRVKSVNSGQFKKDSVPWNKGVSFTKKGKKVFQYSLDMQLINTYVSCVEAAKAVDGNADAISACCRGRSKTSKNFIWKYE